MGLTATKPAARLFAALLAVAALAPYAGAAQIDLSLNLTYSTAGDPTSGGEWQVIAVADEQGLALVGFTLADVSGSATSGLPSGTVDNGADDIGGFNIFDAVPTGSGNLAITAAQAHDPSVLAANGDGDGVELGVFYGVGLSGFDSPGDLGPALTTLESPVNVPWSLGNDVYGRSMFDDAVLVASGSFSPGQTPSFTGSTLGQLYGAVGGADSLGSIVPATSVTTTVIDDALNPDFNGDGMVDAADYTLWRDTFGQTVTAGTGADGNSDGTVDIADYTLWKNNFGSSVGSAAAPAAAAIPEPTSVFLFAAGLGAAAAFRRQKQGVKQVQGVFPKKLQYPEKLLDTPETPSHNASN